MSRRARWWLIMAFPLALVAILGGIIAYGGRCAPLKRVERTGADR